MLNIPKGSILGLQGKILMQIKQELLKRKLIEVSSSGNYIPKRTRVK